MKNKECCQWHDNVGLEGEDCGFFQGCCEDCPTYEIAHQVRLKESI